MTIIDEAKTYCKALLDSFWYEHSVRVAKHAERIAAKEGADKEIVLLAAWLHDIGRSKTQDTKEHVLESISLAGKFLEKNRYDEEKTSKVLNCIETHRGPDPYEPLPKTIESRTLRDANMLDLCGPIGITRVAFMSQKYFGAEDYAEVIRSFDKICNAIPLVLYTNTAQEIAEPFIALQERFFSQLNELLVLGEFDAKIFRKQ